MDIGQTKTVLQVLIDARARIADPEKWCRGDYFIGDSCCSLGALTIAAGLPETFWGGEKIYDHPASIALARAMGKPVHKFNDDERNSHDDILAAFDKAIENESVEH